MGVPAANVDNRGSTTVAWFDIVSPLSFPRALHAQSTYIIPIESGFPF